MFSAALELGTNEMGEKRSCCHNKHQYPREAADKSRCLQNLDSKLKLLDYRAQRQMPKWRPLSNIEGGSTLKKWVLGLAKGLTCAFKVQPVSRRIMLLHSEGTA